MLVVLVMTKAGLGIQLKEPGNFVWVVQNDRCASKKLCLISCKLYEPWLHLLGGGVRHFEEGFNT